MPMLPDTNDEDKIELPAEIGADRAESLLEEILSQGGTDRYVYFAMAALGSIPWVGGVIGALAAIGAAEDQDKINRIQQLWIREHKGKIGELFGTLETVLQRLDGMGEDIRARIESPEYLALVRQVFRSWDQADTQEKKLMLQRLIINAGAIELCADDLVRLFVSWIATYHEAHFIVIREIYRNPGITRGAVWDKIQSERPREDSAEADLYRYLIRDINLGGVIRQVRETDGLGRFMTKDTRGTKGSKSPGPRPMESAFEGTKPYILTALGEQFVHYVMEDVAPQIERAEG